MPLSRISRAMCIAALSLTVSALLAACGGGGGATPPVAVSPSYGAVSTPSPVPYGPPPGSASAGSNVATFDGCSVFAAGGWYNKPIAGTLPDPNSSTYINGAVAAGATGGLEMYFPSSEFINVASSSTPQLTVQQQVSYHRFSAPYPWAPNFKIEPAGDSHAIVLDASTCHLYESYGTSYNASSNTLTAFSGANWDLTKPFVSMPAGQPSAMASGLSLFAGMVKWEDVSSGVIRHALNIAIPAGTACNHCYTAPASAAEAYTFKGSSAYQIPYGAHLRLKASFNIAGLSPQAQIVAKALQTYGAYMADTGCCLELWQAQPLDGNDAHWNSADLATLNRIRMSDFEVMPVGQVTHY
ncbi:hypothetical protein EPN52_00280 [bacterium]|nr:MAG: hypothetical protein EPN52_00280 [bacterium]